MYIEMKGHYSIQRKEQPEVYIEIYIYEQPVKNIGEWTTRINIDEWTANILRE